MGKFFATIMLFVATLNAEAAISENTAIARALNFVDVTEYDLTALKIERGEEQGCAVFKLEFETAFGDYDFAYACSNGELIDADFNLDDKYIKAHRGSSVMSADAACTMISRKLNVPAHSIHLTEQGSRSEPRFDGRCRYAGMEYEFEIDRRSALIIDFTAEFGD